MKFYVSSFYNYFGFFGCTLLKDQTEITIHEMLQLLGLYWRKELMSLEIYFIAFDSQALEIGYAI